MLYNAFVNILYLPSTILNTGFTLFQRIYVLSILRSQNIQRYDSIYEEIDTGKQKLLTWDD